MLLTNYQNRQRRIDKIRHRYPAGVRVMITKYDGEYIKSAEGLATVLHVDAFGVVKVMRDDGTIARIIPGIDTIRFLTDAEMRAEAEKRIVERERQK